MFFYVKYLFYSFLMHNIYFPNGISILDYSKNNYKHYIMPSLCALLKLVIINLIGFSINFSLVAPYVDHLLFHPCYTISCVIWWSFCLSYLLILLYHLLIFYYSIFVVSSWDICVYLLIWATSKCIYTFSYVTLPYLSMIFWLFIFPSVKL